MSTQGPSDPGAPPATTLPLQVSQRFPHTNVGLGPRAENETRLGRRVGPYRLERLLGHGGMGAVYLAQRDDGEFERQVALKLIRHGGEDEISRRRFERERRILSRLEHPAIARLYDGGVDEETGLPWFAMERIEGDNLTAWCSHRRVPLRDRVGLVIAIGHAVQYAHQQLIIHRDLKPSNILVDKHGAPHVLDFGIAAILDEREADRTSPRTAIHTPEYAAPEQIEGAPISAATDVYTLGVLLFELLVGARPFEDSNATAFVIQRAVLEAPTPSLASRLPPTGETRRQLASDRSIAPAQWRRVLRSDLDAIVHKALEKRPQDRYPSMSAFVEDLQRWLDGRPVQAARASVLYRADKFVRRHRLALAVVTGVFLLLTAATLVSLQQARNARQEAERAEAVKQFLVSLFEQARPTAGNGTPLSAQQLLDQGRERLQQDMSDQPRLAGQLLNTIGNAYAHLGDYAQAGAQLEHALSYLPAQGDTLRPRLDVLVDLVDLLSHQDRLADGERYAAEALDQIARLRQVEASPWAWVGSNSRLARHYFGDAEQTVESREEDLALARARLLDLRGERNAAIALRQRVADARDARLGEHPTRIRTAQNDLALALSDAGRQAEAVERFRRLVRDNEREFGPDHASSLTVRHNLALALRRLDRLDEAEPLARANTALAARVLPLKHPMQAYVANTLATILRQQFRHAEAQHWYDTARAVFDDQPEIDRGMLASVHYNSALNRLALFDADGARNALAAADAVWTAAFGAAYPRRIEATLLRVAIALQAVDAVDAKTQLDAADVLLSAKTGTDPQQPRREFLYAQWLRQRGQIAAAEQVLATHWALAQQTWPAPHLEQVAWLQLQAQLASDRGDLAAARERLEHAEVQQRQRHAEPPAELIQLRARLSCAAGDYRRCGEHAAAAETAYADYLPDASAPRQLARAWRAHAQACARPLDVDAQRALDAALLATTERAAAPDLDALRAPCAPASLR